MIVLKFVSHMGHSNFDFHYETEQEAEEQFQAITYALHQTKPDSLVSPVVVRDGAGMKVLINTLNYAVMMYDLDSQVAAEGKKKKAVKDATVKFDEGGEIGFQK